MKRVALLFAVMVMVVALPANTAFARVVTGTAGDDRALIGTEGRDQINGLGGNDVIIGRGSGDVLIGGTGNDDIRGGGGGDLIDAVDGASGDVVRCGTGRDTVSADEGDTVFADCEQVIRVPIGTTPPNNGGDTDCSDRLDNDGDGLIDFGSDPGCSSASDDSELNTPGGGGSGIDCDDDLDNDGDGKTDYPNDPGCQSANDPSEVDDTTTPPNNDADCDDGLDNDGDGKVDFGSGPNNDPDCTSADDPSEFGGTPPNNGGNGRVAICHKPGTPAEKTMTVPQSALKGHLGHGDTVGPCDD